MDLIQIDKNLARELTPKWYYRRFMMRNKPQDYFFQRIDQGFCFILKEIRTKWRYEYLDGEFAKIPELTIEFYQHHAGRSLQNQPLKANLLCTPGNDGVERYAAPSAVDNDIFGICFTATPPKNNILLNHFYQINETIDIRLSFTELMTAGNDYVDLVLIGYYMPNRSLEMWS